MEVQGEGMSDNNITPNMDSESGYANAGNAVPGPVQGNPAGVAAPGEAYAPVSSDAAPRVMRSASSSIFPAVSADPGAAGNAVPPMAPSAPSTEFAASSAVRAPRSAHSDVPRTAGVPSAAAAPVHSSLDSVPATPRAPRHPQGEGAAAEAQRRHKTPRARRMKLSLTRIDPWSATKVGFMLSVAISLILIVALSVAWGVFMGSNAMTSINSLVSSSGLDSMTSGLSSIFSMSHVISVLVLLGVFNTVLFTLLAAIFAFLYNLTARLVGGLRVTLGDD